MATPNELLEVARIRKRWSVAVASEKAGVSVNTFNRWERGLQVPQLGTLDQVCKAFDMTPEELGFGHVIRAKRRSRVKEQKTSNSTSTTSQAPVIPPSPEADTTVITAFSAPMCELHACDEQAERSLDGMDHLPRKQNGGDGVSRRQAIAALLGTPATVFGLAQNVSATVLHPEEVVSLCSVHIPLSWQLYFEGGFAEVGRVIPGYLLQLSKLTQERSHYQQRAAILASQAYQLASLVSLQYQNFGTAFHYARRAFAYGEQAGDANLQTASLIRQAQVQLYLRHPQQRLETYEQALQCSRKTSPLLQGRVYIGLAEAHSTLKHESEARHYLELAQNTWPAQSEDDPNFSYTHFNGWSITSFVGLLHLNLGQPTQAWAAFARIDKSVPHGLVPNRIELNVRQAMAAYELGDRDQACAYVASAASAAKAVHNHLRFDEVYKVYEDMQERWGKERQVRNLKELFLQA